MKVAIINQHPATAIGGSEVQCDLIARGLEGLGHKVVYIAPGLDPARSAGAPYGIAAVSRTVRAIVDATLDHRPDVVYWRFNKRLFRRTCSKLAASGFPIVFAVSHVNDVTPWATKRTLTPWAGLPRLLLNRWEHGGFKHVRILTVNNRNHLGRAPVPRQHYVPNGMRADEVPFDWPRAFCAWVGNIKPAKRPEAFVDLARRLQATSTDFIMVGAIRSTSYEWIREGRGCPPNLYYLGERSLNEVNGILAASALHIHTCEPEGFSNVFIQAWLQGTPSVSLGFDPAGSIESEGLGLSARDDRDEFFRQVRYLLEEPEERERMGERALAFAGRTFGVDRLARQVEQILVEAIHTVRS